MCIHCDLRAFKWLYCFVDFAGGLFNVHLLRVAEKIFTDTLCCILILFDMKLGFIYPLVLKTVKSLLFGSFRAKITTANLRWTEAFHFGHFFLAMCY